MEAWRLLSADTARRREVRLASGPEADRRAVIRVTAANSIKPATRNAYRPPACGSYSTVKVSRGFTILRIILGFEGSSS